jgi:hypothetical protein
MAADSHHHRARIATAAYGFNTNPAQPSTIPTPPAKQSIESCNPTASFKIKPIAPPTHCGLSHPCVENSGDF